ncbi:hypothetical protein ATPR_1333 [Acetobacter tropicalis NBRC 101654]|uniref:Uncharacterized protein n=1 Tax=Acetobacter tropicalis NBRC 101654 TaxID=749388 RepID=F7VD84_9PROT|nr:hypothetical protein ATPR_1333 [Acetobacter tropicalis NBRC 101654]
MERMRQIFRPDFHFGDSERQKADYRDQSAAEGDIIEECLPETPFLNFAEKFWRTRKDSNL